MALVAACGDDQGRPDVGTVTLALVQVPSDVSCIGVTVTGNRTVTRLADVMPGQPSNLTFGGLPVGTDTFTGAAYGTSCAMVTTSSVPNWVGVPVTAVVNAMTSTPVTLVLQKNGRASVSIDFNDGPTCDATSCPTGCCSGGMCNPGSAVTACGTGGGACLQCAAGQACVGGSCTAVCDATTCPTGCCAGTTCVARSLSACGANGGACTACDPVRADNCGPGGACSCGGGAACLSGQHCVGGACVCDATSCMTGCCTGTTCSARTFSTCGTNGLACVACDSVHADSCGPSGACTCGSGPPCATGLHCAAGACLCDATSCAGCCAGGLCQPGTTSSLCGAGGVGCVSCGQLFCSLANHSCSVTP